MKAILVLLFPVMLFGAGDRYVEKINDSTYSVSVEGKLDDSQEVYASCLPGDELFTGGCHGPNWLSITEFGPSLVAPLSIWKCQYAKSNTKEIRISAIVYCRKK